MNLNLYRFSDDQECTLGIMFVNGTYQCYTLEDKYNPVKIKHHTRIPSGTYQIKKRLVLSDKTKRYRNKYDWFDYHLELQDVPDYQYVYIHVGNKEDDTSGCILVGNGQTSNKFMNSGSITNSAVAFKTLYLAVTNALNSGEDVYITITDEGYFYG